MKKSRSMRLASALLVLTLLSTCMISGTFAKYVTAEEGSDVARVAKFGVNIVVDGELFSETYKDFPATDNSITVQSFGEVEDVKNLVAPGTKSKTGGLNFSVTGTPEVDVRVYFDTTDLGTDADNDVFLKANTYKDPTTSDPDDTFTLDGNYYPVKYVLKKNNEVIIQNATLAELKEKLNTYSFDVEANTDLATAIGTYTIEWAWAYGEPSEVGEIKVVDEDRADTVLGNLAAGTFDGLTKGTDYNLVTGLNVKIAVEQID